MNAALLSVELARRGHLGVTAPALSSLVGHAHEHGLEAVLAWVDDDPALLWCPSWQWVPWLLFGLRVRHGGRGMRDDRFDSVPELGGARCRVCGCDDDRACLNATGQLATCGVASLFDFPVTCHWVEPDLCSRCAYPPRWWSGFDTVALLRELVP